MNKGGNYMKIALVAPLVSPIAPPFIGGAQAMVADLAQGLFHRGHHVTLFAREGSYIPGVPIEQIPVPESVRHPISLLPGQERRVDPGFFCPG